MIRQYIYIYKKNIIFILYVYVFNIILNNFGCYIEINDDYNFFFDDFFFCNDFLGFIIKEFFVFDIQLGFSVQCVGFISKGSVDIVIKLRGVKLDF